MTAALGAVLEAFIREHEYCGELDTGLEDDRVDDVYVRGGDGPAPREGGEGGSVMETPRRSDRPRLLLWLNTAAKLRARLLTLERGVAREELERGVAREELTVRPEDTLRAAGISSRRQAKYQRRMSSLLAGRER